MKNNMKSAFKKVSFWLFLNFFLVFFLGCSYSLEETPGVFTIIDTNVYLNGQCEHYFMCDLSYNHTSSTAYPPSEYHYVYCVNYGIDIYCDFSPRFERHELSEYFESYIIYRREVLMYNGHLYNEVFIPCTGINCIGGKTKYILKNLDKS